MEYNLICSTPWKLLILCPKQEHCLVIKCGNQMSGEIERKQKYFKTQRIPVITCMVEEAYAYNHVQIWKTSTPVCWIYQIKIHKTKFDICKHKSCICWKLHKIPKIRQLVQFHPWCKRMCMTSPLMGGAKICSTPLDINTRTIM